ncbi:MAG: GC-type dockerin domain-anchored protein [Phycisphaerales bacterium]
MRRDVRQGALFAGAAAAMVCCAIAATATPRTTKSFTDVNSIGAFLAASNSIRVATVDEEFTAHRVNFTGVLEPVAPGTWAADARIMITPPTGLATIFQPTTTEAFSEPITISGLSFELTAPVAAVGEWQFRFFEDFIDAPGGVESVWRSANFELDDALPPPRWTETTDAPDLFQAAQECEGSGTLSEIRGFILGDETDLYAIDICNPSAFTASTIGRADWDTVLMLFAQDGTGVAMSDDEPSGALRQSLLTGQFVTTPGRYYIAINQFGRRAVTFDGLPIWNEQPFNLERAPDGPASLALLAGWTSVNPGVGGIYTIALSGACFVASTPVCVADVDDGQATGVPDGAVTIDDLLFYLGEFQAGRIRADVDDGSGSNTPDGAVTIDDLLYYLGRFSDGC